MKGGLPLAAYDAAWRLALGPLRGAARLDAFLRGRFGRGCLPAEWRVEERLMLDPAPSAGPAAPEAPGHGGQGDPSDPNGQAGQAGQAGQGRAGERGGLGDGTVWMHAASLGECQGLWALYESLSGAFPGAYLLTAQTAAGYESLRRAAARAPGGGPAVRMAPLDHPGLVRGFLDRHGVVALVLYEVELWPGFIRAASARGIPALAVSARMTPRALARCRILRGTWSSLLDRLDWIQARSEEDAARIRSLARAPVAAGADFKIARHRGALAAAAGAEPGAGRLPEGPSAAPPDRRRFAFLSLHLRELAWFRPALPELMERFPLTVLPRRPSEMEAFRRALLPLGFALHGRDPGARHVLVDSLGRAGEVLPACGSAFVGGSLVPAGCHNLWEPLLAGLRIYFGPSTFNQEPLARRLIGEGLAEEVTDPGQARAWREPGPGTAAACRALALGQFRLLEDAEAALHARFRGSLAGFYLNSGISGSRERRLPGRVESIG